MTKTNITWNFSLFVLFDERPLPGLIELLLLGGVPLTRGVAAEVGVGVPLESLTPLLFLLLVVLESDNAKLTSSRGRLLELVPFAEEAKDESGELTALAEG